MTTIPGEPVAAADAQQSSTSLHSLHLSVLLASLPFGLLVLGLPLIAREMGASALAIGGLFSIYSLIIVVLQPIVGHGLDRFGRRPFLIAGLLGLRLLERGLWAGLWRGRSVPCPGGAGRRIGAAVAGRLVRRVRSGAR